MVTVTLKRGRDRRVRAGHPWVYRGEIAEISPTPQPGELVVLHDARRAFLGRGYINPASEITVRLLTFTDEAVDLHFFRRRINAAQSHRQSVVQQTAAYRLIYSEADMLSGLIVDRYNDLLVAQVLTAGMAALTELWVPALREVLSPRGIYQRSDLPARRLEGLLPVTGFLSDPCETALTVEEGGVKFWVDVAAGHKTGLFLDQRENRLAVRSLSTGREVLDGFCYTGGFGLHAAVAGARSVLGIDSNAEALATAVKNAELNGVSQLCRFEEGNLFDRLRRFQAEGRQFDLIILDPPAFTKSKDTIEGALRGYKEINLRAMKILREGGILVSCSCSYHLPEALFREMLQEAAADARRRFRLRAMRTQAADHPILLSVRESQYLKCALLEAVP